MHPKADILSKNDLIRHLSLVSKEVLFERVLFEKVDFSRLDSYDMCSSHGLYS